MSLLDDVQNAAVDSSSDLSSLLRKCKLLAARLGSSPLENWLLWESNGYPKDVDLPEYRLIPIILKGQFSGPFGSGMNNAPIPYVCLPAACKKLFKEHQCRQSIAVIEDLVRRYKGGSFQVNTGDLAVHLGQDVYQGQNCIHAWGEVGNGSLIEILNAVRNRILDFSLALWKEAPQAGDLNAANSNLISSVRVNQIFNTTINGGSANLIAASQSELHLHIIQNDFNSLKNALQVHGVSEEDINLLYDAFKKEDKIKTPGKYGEMVSSWIARMSKKAADGSWQIGLSAAGNLLSQAISKYYGLP